MSQIVLAKNKAPHPRLVSAALEMDFFRWRRCARCGVLRAEQFAEAAGEEAGESLLEGVAAGCVAVGGEFVHELREELGDVAGDLIGGDAGLRGHLLELIRAEDLLDLRCGGGRVRAGADPAFDEVAEAVAAEFGEQALDAAALAEEACDGTHEVALLVVVEAAGEGAEEAVE